jgi:hypothetical protein
MKRFAYTLLAIMALAQAGFAQNINWRSIDDDRRNTIQLTGGYAYGAVAGVSYGRAFTLVRPIVAGLEYSFPMGKTLTDDFTVRITGQVDVLDLGGFSFTARIVSNFRRYQTSLVRIVSFGSDLAAVAGYYAPTWHAAGEFGFDKAIATEIEHSQIMKANIPGVRDGWYVPTGGNFYYGIQGGKTIGEHLEASLRVGSTRAQFHDESAVIPYYLQIGLGVKF